MKYKKDFLWILTTFIGLPSLLLLARDIGISGDLFQPVKSVVNSWESWLALLETPIRYFVVPLLDYWNSVLGFDVKLFEHWRTLFIILYIETISVTRVSWGEENLRWITSLDYVFRVFGALLAAIIIGLFPLTDNWITQGFAAFLSKLAFNLLIVVSPVAILKLHNSLLGKPSALKVGGEFVDSNELLNQLSLIAVAISSFYFVAAALLTAVPNIGSKACLLVVLGVSVVRGAYQLINGIAQGNERHARLGATAIGGYLAALVVMSLNWILVTFGVVP